MLRDLLRVWHHVWLICFRLNASHPDTRLERERRKREWHQKKEGPTQNIYKMRSHRRRAYTFRSNALFYYSICRVSAVEMGKPSSIVARHKRLFQVHSHHVYTNFCSKRSTTKWNFDKAHDARSHHIHNHHQRTRARCLAEHHRCHFGRVIISQTRRTTFWALERWFFFVLWKDVVHIGRAAL